MEAFFVVVLAVALLGVGAAAPSAPLKMKEKKKIDPTDPQER